MKPKPSEIFREEVTHGDGTHAVRQSFDRKQYEDWKRLQRTYKQIGASSVLSEGTILWDDRNEYLFRSLLDLVDHPIGGWENTRPLLRELLRKRLFGG